MGNLPTIMVEQKTKIHRWHNDIKPENILNVRGEFKLADPGFARFEKQEEGKDATDWIGGTSTFGMAFIASKVDDLIT